MLLHRHVCVWRNTKCFTLRCHCSPGFAISSAHRRVTGGCLLGLVAMLGTKFEIRWTDNTHPTKEDERIRVVNVGRWGRGGCMHPPAIFNQWRGGGGGGEWSFKDEATTIRLQDRISNILVHSPKGAAGVNGQNQYLCFSLFFVSILTSLSVQRCQIM